MERQGKWLYPVLTVEVEFRGILNVVTASATPTAASAGDRPTSLAFFSSPSSTAYSAPAVFDQRVIGASNVSLQDQGFAEFP